MKLAVLGFLLAFAHTADDRFTAPSDFKQREIASKAAQVAETWRKWSENTAHLETELTHLPAEEGLKKIQDAYRACLVYLEAYRGYGLALALALEGNPGMIPATADQVNIDQMSVAAANQAKLESALDGLRSTPGWLSIRLATQDARSALMRIQSARRDAIDDDFSTTFRNPKQLITPAAFRKSDEELQTVLHKLWTDYFIAIAEGTYHTSAGIVGRGQPSTAHAAAIDTANFRRSDVSAYSGTWAYREGSQQFNAVAEPKNVLLELTVESGELRGRYRAELTGFDGVHSVDLNLRGKVTQAKQTTLTFVASGSGVSGKLILTGSLSEGTELMVVRSVEASNLVPAGREILSRW